MRPSTRTLSLAAALALAIGVNGHAAEPTSEGLYRWGECAVAGGVYQGAITRGTKNARITEGFRQFEVLAPRMKKHVEDLSEALGADRSEVVLARLKRDYTAVFADWEKQADPDAFLIRTITPIMDRCLSEAAALPEG